MLGNMITLGLCVMSHYTIPATKSRPLIQATKEAVCLVCGAQQ